MVLAADGDQRGTILVTAPQIWIRLLHRFHAEYIITTIITIIVIAIIIMRVLASIIRVGRRGL